MYLILILYLANVHTVVGLKVPILFLSFKHLFVDIGIDDDDDGAFWCTAHTALIPLVQVHTLVTYPDVSTSPL